MTCKHLVLVFLQSLLDNMKLFDIKTMLSRHEYTACNIISNWFCYNHIMMKNRVAKIPNSMTFKMERPLFNDKIKSSNISNERMVPVIFLTIHKIFLL